MSASAENDDDHGQGSQTSTPPSSALAAIDISSASLPSYSPAAQAQKTANQEDLGHGERLASRSANYAAADGGGEKTTPPTGIVALVQRHSQAWSTLIVLADAECAGDRPLAAAIVSRKPLVHKSQVGSISEDQEPSTAARTRASKPIAIDMPNRRRQFHTPLSARGDLIGYFFMFAFLFQKLTTVYFRGYFPFHETAQRSLETHPFNKSSSKENRDYHAEMVADSPLSTPAVTEPSQHNSPYHHHYPSDSPEEPHFTMRSETPGTPPLISMPPLGKYHPANYQNKTPSISLQTPRPQPTSSRPPPRAISPQVERAKSDVKSNQQLLRKYQRDMVEQATRAARRAGATIEDPGAPKLIPLGSPGPVTPMALEESNAAGYLVGGATRGSSYRQGENSREADMVGRMIRAEEERRRREGQSSPLATAGGDY